MKFAYLIEPPLNHRTPEGIVTGTDVELAKIVAYELGLGKFEPIETEFAELLPGVVDGRWRMTTGLFSTEERRELALFSRPIWGLPDGLLVKAGNPNGLIGYKSVAQQSNCVLAVIRDQFQHRSAVEFGIAYKNIKVFETYIDAAHSVLNGDVDAYASVGKAHTGYIEVANESRLEVVTVPTAEKQPAFGSFAFSKQDSDLCEDVNLILRSYLGSEKHRKMMTGFGFSNADIDLVLHVDE